jgi:hypothetical protein
MRRFLIPILLLSTLPWMASPAFGQSLGNAGTIEVTVNDPSGAQIRSAQVSIANSITGYRQTATIDSEGHFRLTNIPPNNYTLSVTAQGFATSQREVAVRSTVPLPITIPLQLEAASTTVTVEAAGGNVLLENVPSAHTDMDRSMYDKLPINNPGGGLSDALMYGTPGVVADGQGFFHPIGDHAETTFSIDGQTISDQQSKLFSTQLPLNAIQSMELITGTPNAEYGGKTSLIVDTVTRSGLGLTKATGSISGQYGSFGTGAVATSPWVSAGRDLVISLPLTAFAQDAFLIRQSSGFFTIEGTMPVSSIASM